MGRKRRAHSPAFESIMRGLEQAIAYQRGELVEGVSVHRFERLPDGSVRRVVEAGGTADVESPVAPLDNTPTDFSR